MGWDTYDGDEELLRDYDLPDGNSVKIIDSERTCATQLWVVYEMTWPDQHTDRWISVYVTDAQIPGMVKSLDEIMGPHYYRCPLRFLDLVPPPADHWGGKGWAAQWRLEVRKRAGQQSLAGL